MKLHIVTMEADSTTLECGSNNLECSSNDRENDIFFCYNGGRSFYNQRLKPLLSNQCGLELLEWMKDRRLLSANSKCQMDSPHCKLKMVKANVIDKYQWKCKHCGFKTSVRQNSVFKNVRLPLTTALKMIQAWCYDMDYVYVAAHLGIKKQLVDSMFSRIDKIVSMRTPDKLGGLDSLVLIEMYPDGTVEHNPDSSRSDSDLTKHKILCLADTKCVPTRYLMHVITGFVKKETENNNSTLERVKPITEIHDFITKNVLKGGFCMIGSSSDLNLLPELLRKSDTFDGMGTVETLSSKSGSQMKEFMTDTIWRHAVTLCEAAQELPKKQMQTYLDCALWRRDMSNVDMFPNVLQLMAQKTEDCQRDRSNNA